jgi:hypothetical protein
MGRDLAIKAPQRRAEPSDVILLDEAIERCNRSGRAYGVRIDPWRRRAKARQLIGAIEADIFPLELPDELRTFWLRWNPASVVRPAFDGFIPLEHIIERREMDCPPCPSILLPIADWAHARIWIELASEEHPGGRIFHSYHDESELSLWGFGISGLLDLVSVSFERDFIDDRSGSIDARRMEQLIAKNLDDTLPAHLPRRFDGVDRSRFPAHWQAAEGLGQDHFSLRGASHTVEGFRIERENHAQVVGTLVGSYETSVGGGPLHGCIGTFRDVTGSIEVFVPQVTAMTGAVGDGGAVEIDVVAVAPNGSGLQSLSAKQDLQLAFAAGSFDAGHDMIMRLFEQMKYLDTSIVVTAMRPIR